jgi:serine/threonine protein kinase/Tfp pilus assembly protein PilF
MALSIPQMALMSQLLDEALPLDAAGRRAWLDALSPEHRALESVLREALLPEQAQSAEHRSLTTLPKLGSAADAANAQGASGLQAGAHVGPYQLIRLLGAGGMAEVWLARRADGAFTREVALKLPLLTRLQEGLEARFARERDILASLEHPHIARFYDAGMDPNGLPYLSMEYVQGEPLTSWCEKHGLAINQRLALVLQVLEAMQYAHGKHVIHRDLKPSNILVNDSGQVRLLDFGVARLLEKQELDQLSLTSVYGRALTPDYASPELLRGDPIDARSDLYSLGVMLYELLTGTQPYRLKRAASIGALDQAVATLEVKRPSMQLELAAATTHSSSAERLVRQLRGDLDSIALMALAKDPAQRYPSAAALAADLRCYLANKPIQSRSARAAYRLRKLVLRNRALVAVSAAAMVAILATPAYLLYRERIAQVTVSAKSLDTPPARLRGSSAVSVPPMHSVAVLPFLDMSEKKDQEYFSDGLAEELLDLLAKVPGLQVTARTSSFSFKGKSVDIPEIGRKLNVANVLEGSVRKSGDRLRVSTQLVRADTGVQFWSETYDRELKDVFEVQDEIASAVVSALKLKLAPGQQPSNSHRTSNTKAYNEYLLGRQFFDRFDLDGFKRAALAYRKAVELDPGYAAAYAELAMSEYFAADAGADPAGIRDALKAADTAVTLAPDQADGYASRGHIRVQAMWNWTGAQEDFQRALALDPGNSLALRRYGLLLGAFGRLPEAIAMTKRAIELDPLSSVTWSNLGMLATGARQFAAADDAIRRALEIQPESPYGLNDLGTLQLLQAKAAQALATARRSDENSRLEHTAMAEYSLGHARESQQALDRLIAKFGHDCAYCVAGVYAWRGEKDQAFDWLDRAFRQRESGLTEIKYQREFDTLLGDERYTALMHRMNLPE